MPDDLTIAIMDYAFCKEGKIKCNKKRVKVVIELEKMLDMPGT